MSRPAALIVEDQPFVGLVASDILKESGFEIFHAYDADDAVALLDQHPEIVVMLTEAKLPGEISGLELCRCVSGKCPNVQLVVTAAGDELSASEMPHGAQMLRKPYANAELRYLVAAKALLQDA